MRTQTRQSVGRIKFFDSIKNHFGFITDVRTRDGDYGRDVYVAEAELVGRPADFTDGRWVLFQLQASGRPNAHEVRLVEHASSEQATQAIMLLSGSVQLNLVESLLKNDFRFKPADAGTICDVLLAGFSTANLALLGSVGKLVLRLGAYPQKKALLDTISTLSDVDKWTHLGRDKTFLAAIAETWGFQDNAPTQALIKRLLDTPIKSLSARRFIETAEKYYAHLNQESRLLLLKLDPTNSKQRDRLLVEWDFKDKKEWDDLIGFIDQTYRGKAKERAYNLLLDHLLEHVAEVEASAGLHVAETYHGHSAYTSLLESLIRYSQVRDVESWLMLEKAASASTDEAERPLDRLLASRLKQEVSGLSASDRLTLLKKTTRRTTIEWILTSWTSRGGEIDGQLITELVTQPDRYRSFSEYIEKMVMQFDIGGLLRVRMGATYCLYEPFLRGLSEIVLTGPDILLELLRIIKRHHCSTSFLERITSSDTEGNIGRRGMILRLFAMENYLPPVVDFSEIVRCSSPLLQPLLLKRLIKLHHNGTVDTPTLESYLSAQWTDLSTLLILAFIRHTGVDTRTMMREMNLVFKTHIQFLNEIEQPMGGDAWIDLDQVLRINQLVKKCDGRKKYRISKSGLAEVDIGDSENIYCEGRFWKQDVYKDFSSGHRSRKKLPHYWCRGRLCVQDNQESNINLPYIEWTLHEIAHVLGLRLDSSAYKTIAGWANRMNEVVDRLYCRSCNTVLRPVAFDPSKLGYYALPLFKCVKDACDQQNVTIRITHCLHRDCGRMVDSRDSPRCANGWLVCQFCYACCDRHHDEKFVSCPRCGRGSIRKRDGIVDLVQRGRKAPESAAR